MGHKNNRVPPQNIEAEQSFLAGLMIYPGMINEVAYILKSEDFYRGAHGAIYEIIMELNDRLDAVDIITVSSIARDKGVIEGIGGVAYLNSLVDLNPSAANIAHYGRIVKEMALIRQLMNVATEIIERGFDLGVNAETQILVAKKMFDTIVLPGGKQ